MALTNEDLLAISQLLDVKLRAEIQPIKNEVQALRSKIQSVRTELQTEIHQIKLFQENIILPRLNTIESCYTSTYIRYSDSVESYEAIQADNEIMKKVLMEHREKLQRLA